MVKAKLHRLEAPEGSLWPEAGGTHLAWETQGRHGGIGVHTVPEGPCSVLVQNVREWWLGSLHLLGWWWDRSWLVRGACSSSRYVPLEVWHSGQGGLTMDFRHEGDAEFWCTYHLDFSAIIHWRLIGAIPPPASTDHPHSTCPQSSPHKRTLPYYSWQDHWHGWKLIQGTHRLFAILIACHTTQYHIHHQQAFPIPSQSWLCSPQCCHESPMLSQGNEGLLPPPWWWHSLHSWILRLRLGRQSWQPMITSAFVFCLGFGAISWKSIKQKLVTLSTVEAEYMVMCQAVKEAICLNSLLEDLGVNFQSPLANHSDNQGTLALMQNPDTHLRWKHVDIQYHYTRELINAGCIAVKYIPTKFMIADVLMKQLPPPQFMLLIEEMGVYCNDWVVLPVRGTVGFSSAVAAPHSCSVAYWSHWLLVLRFG